MNLQPEQENHIRRYILGVATPDEMDQVEIGLLRGDVNVEILLLIEDELITDYALGALPRSERELMEKNFFSTPERRERLMLAHEMARQASALDKARAAEERDESHFNNKPGAMRQTMKRFAALFRPGHHTKIDGIDGIGGSGRIGRSRLKAGAYAALLIGLGLGIWHHFRGESEVEKGLVALEQAYNEQRPLKARISGFDYAPSAPSGLRGSAETQKVDRVALDRAKIFLFSLNAGDSDPEINHALGKYYLTQNEFDTAIERFRKALDSGADSPQLRNDLGAALLARTDRDRTADPGVDVRKIARDFNESLAHLNKALELSPTMREALFNRALLYRSQQLRRQALADYEAYLLLDADSRWAGEVKLAIEEIKRELGKVSQRNELLFQSFNDAVKAGDDDRMLQTFSQSYSFNGNYIIEKLVDRFLTAKSEGRESESVESLKAISQIGKLAEENTGDRFAADLAHYYQRARPDQLEMSKSARELMNKAYEFYRKAENDSAVELYGQAMRLFERAGDVGEALFAQSWIGLCHHQRSDVEQNLQIFNELVPACAERSYRWMQSNALCGLANAHNSSGQFSQAIADSRQCGEIANDLGDQIGVIRTSYMLGYFYYQLGKHDENLRISWRGRRVADDISADIRYAIGVYNLPAWSLSALGFHEAAFAFQREAVRMAEESKLPRLIAYANVYQGLIYARHRRFNEAIASAQHGVDIGRELKNEATGRDFMHIGLLCLGQIYREAGKFPEALSAFNQVIEFSQQSGKQAYFYGAAKGRLLTLIAQGNDAEAQAELERVLSLYENYRKSIQEESNRNSFFDQEQDTYDVAIDFAQTRLKNSRQAFAYAELSRARSLRDAINRGWKMTAGPEYPDLKINADQTPPGIDQIQRQIPADAQLLEYAMLKDKLVIWLISKTSIEDHVVPIPLAELKERVDQYLTLINQPPGKNDQEWREKAMELHDILARPIESLLDGRKQICVIPDKALTRLPFGALVARSSGRLLTEDYRISYASSANLFLDLTEKARRKSSLVQERLLAVGNPRYDRRAFPSLDDLPSARTEAIEIANFYTTPRTPPIVLVDAAATKSAIMRGMERADVAHLALHYAPDPWSPMLSRMPLASGAGNEKDGILQMYELYRLKSPGPRLVVLSACQTRSEEYLNGEGAIGASRPFEAAGIPLVVASLWPVVTDATSDLMINFHRERKLAGRSTAEALRAAQLKLISSAGDYRHPYYWAAFILVGGYSDY
jgi:CHAT domain-containing protein